MQLEIPSAGLLCVCGKEQAVRQNFYHLPFLMAGQQNSQNTQNPPLTSDCLLGLVTERTFCCTPHLTSTGWGKRDPYCWDIISPQADAIQEGVLCFLQKLLQYGGMTKYRDPTGSPHSHQPQTLLLWF